MNGRFGAFKKNDQSRSATTKTQEYVAEPRPTEVCRYVFPLNNCGSKQIIIAHDVNQDFAPVFTIEKTGGLGIRISQEGFQSLCNNKDYISEYFGSSEPSYRQESINLSTGEVLQFKQQWGNNLAVLKNTTDEKYQVTFAKQTWDGLKNLLPLLDCILLKMNHFKPEIMKIFIASAKLLKTALPTEYTTQNSPFVNHGNVSEILQNLDFNNLQYDVVQNNLFDSHQMFIELRTLCVKELITYMYYV